MKAVLILMWGLVSTTLNAQSSAGPRSAGNFANNTSTGTVAWVNAGNVISSDNSYSTVSVSLGLLSSANTNYLVASNFGFSLSGTSVITGIKVEVEKQYDILLGVLSSVSDNAVRLVKGGVIGGTNKAAGSWSSTDAYTSYGGSSDLWGQTWSPADINSSNFGVAVSANISSGLASLTMDALVDHIRITVYFNVTVPVHFVDVDAAPAGNKICIHWSTATESSSRFFVAEKLLPSTTEWIPVDTVKAAGESRTIKEYVLYDTHPDENALYRIREINMDGLAEFSKVVRLNGYHPQPGKVKLQPNPANNRTLIIASSPLRQVQLLHLSGQQLRQISLPGTDYQFELGLEGLPKGVYTLLLETKSSREVKMLLVE